MKLPYKDVTNSPKDWHDFWYSSEHMYPNETKHEYNELVDYLVSNMTLHSTKDSYTQTGDINAPFDTQAYDNYKELVNKKREEMSTSELTETIMQLGFKLDQTIDKVLLQVDKIIEVLDREFPDK